MKIACEHETHLPRAHTFFLPLLGLTQTRITAFKPNCGSLLLAGDTHLRRQNLQQSLQCYLGALNCNSQLAGRVGPKIEAVFGRQRKSEQAAKEMAEKRRVEADSTAAAAQHAALTAYANDLAYKSQIAIERGDRTTAFRLAEFAHRYLDADNHNVIRALLEAFCYNDHPDKTHRLPWNYALIGHSRSVNSIAFSPNGRKLATGSSDNTAKIWDLKSRKDELTFEGHSGGINSMAFSPSGHSLATGSWDKAVKIWDLTSGKAELTLEGHSSGINKLAFSPDEHKISTWSYDRTAKVWDLTPEEIIRRAHNNPLAELILPQLQVYDFDNLLELSSDPGISNEAELIQSGEAGQIQAFAVLYDQKTQNSQQLEHTAQDFARAVRLYQAALYFGADSQYILNRLGALYQRWATNILNANRPDTAASYIEITCGFGFNQKSCIALQIQFSKKVGKKFDFQRFVSSENAEDLRQYANYFYETEQWPQAVQLYEKSEQLRHNPKTLLRLFIVAEKTRQSFDFQRLLVSDKVEDLRYYADYFYEKRLWLEANKLYEKAEQLEHSPVSLLHLFDISENTSQSFNFQRFLSSENIEELTQYEDYFIQKAERLDVYRDRITTYQSALLLREKQLTLDTTSATRVEVALEYSNLGFYQLFLPDGVAAQASLRRAFELDSSNIHIPTNLAPALLLQGRWPEAEKEYRKWKDLEYDENDLPTYREAFLSDLDELEKQGVTHPDFARARALLKQQ